MKRINSIEELGNFRKQLQEDVMTQGRPAVKVCCGVPCLTAGAKKVVKALRKEAEINKIDIEVIETGCQGPCQKAPVMKIEPQGIFYEKVRQNNIKELVNYTFVHNIPYRPLLHRESILSEPTISVAENPFYKKQLPIALRNCGHIDPRNIYHFIQRGGYAALEKALSSMSPADVLNMVDKANLRGRGGAGFPAGTKWRHATKNKEKIRFVVANGDEGDPGAFMDRSVMEGDPHSLIEGMLLCAYAIEAQYGFIYVRHEYPLAIKNLEIAINQARELGLLGENILGSNLSFHITIYEGAGAFVCGESTALVASVEGDRGFPRPRPPRLSEIGGGLWGFPTNLNNIETFACVPVIIEKGADYFLSIGTEGSPGTKCFSVVGKVKNTGIIEVPMGITLREIIYDIGGGIIGDKKFKAVQTGGPSGGCIPEQFLDLPVDFDSLRKVGSIMGSGGMVVLDEDNCMVDVAKFFLSFTQSESCGKCPPCRIGTYQMLQLLEKITAGDAVEGDIDKLETLGKLVKAGSLCGLGQSAPNPVLTTLKYFLNEYEEHVKDKYCRANVCNKLGIFFIENFECIRCGLCKEACAFEAVTETKDLYSIDRTYCTKCKACYYACPVGAVKIMTQWHVMLEEELKIPPKGIEIIERRWKMTLRAILEAKPDPYKIVTITKDHKVEDAIKLMKENNVSGIFVLDKNNKLQGIFTERDIVRCVVEKISIEDETIANAMRHDITTFDPSMEMSTAITIASRKKIRHLPIIEGDRIIGMITFRDLVLYLLPEICFMTEAIY